jgi:hypothetical protein
MEIVNKTFLESILKERNKDIFYCLHYLKKNNKCSLPEKNRPIIGNECKDCPNRLIPNQDDPGSKGAVGGGGGTKA